MTFYVTTVCFLMTLSMNKLSQIMSSQLRAGSHRSQVPFMLAGPNIEAKSQLFNLKRPLE